MARITINTRDAGPLTFYVSDRGGYVYLESGERHGTLGRQICEGGGTMGSTIHTDHPETLPAIARRWNRQRRAALARR